MCVFALEAWWIRELDLYEEDKRQMEKGCKLSDKIINAVHTLLRQQFKNITGFQNSLLGNNLKFNPVKSLPTLQIIYTG